jgi:hypothetical protein
MQSAFYIGTIRIVIDSSFDFIDYPVSKEKRCDSSFNLTFSLNQSHYLPSSVEWIHGKTHKWGRSERAYYLWSKKRLEFIDASSDITSLWRCTIEKDFSRCIVTPPKINTQSFWETLIFNRILTGFVVNKPMVVCHCCASYINNVGIVFLGKSGAGKSTLAQIISNENGCVLADDRTLLFRAKDNKLYMAGVPQKTDKKCFYNNIVVPVQKVFLLQKDYPLGVYKLNTKDRYIALAESLFQAPFILSQTIHKTQLLNCYNLFNGINVQKLGFENNSKTWDFLHEKII